MRLAILLWGLGACASSPAGKPSTASHASTASGAASTKRQEPAPEAICARLTGLKNEHCGVFTDMDVDADKCPRAFRTAQEGPPSTARLALRQLVRMK
jgi:hypothetical protein